MAGDTRVAQCCAALEWDQRILGGSQTKMGLSSLAWSTGELFCSLLGVVASCDPQWAARWEPYRDRFMVAVRHCREKAVALGSAVDASPVWAGQACLFLALAFALADLVSVLDALDSVVLWALGRVPVPSWVRSRTGWSWLALRCRFEWMLGRIRGLKWWGLHHWVGTHREQFGARVAVSCKDEWTLAELETQLGDSVRAFEVHSSHLQSMVSC